MTVDVSNVSSNSDNSTIIAFLVSVDNKVYFVEQFFGFIYSLVCAFWIVYVGCDLFTKMRKGRKLDNLTYFKPNSEFQNRIFMDRETILRNSIFLLFLCFEMTYSLTTNIFGIIYTFTLINYQDTSIQIAPNCRLDTGTFIGSAYDRRFGMIVLNVINVLRYLSFSMMIWLFGVSLFHLSFAARNELRVKSVLHYILLGLVINIILMAFALIPYTSIFGTIVHNVMDQISILISIYIAKRKFFPAMNSRIIDAFHYNNVRVYLEQKRLLHRYKFLICFLTFTFEIYILKNLILYNLYVIFESISLNPCWFNVTYHFPVFSLLESTQDILHQISAYFQISGHLTDIVVYLNFILINLLLIYLITRKYYKRMPCCSKKYRYRYQVYSAPLLSDTK